MGFDHMCNTGLGLGLGCLQSDHDDHLKQKKLAPLKLDDHDFYPSLTLGLSDQLSPRKMDSGRVVDGDYHHQTTTNLHQRQASSSFSNNSSVKRERDSFCGEDEDLERVLSSRVSDEEEDQASPRKKLRLTKEQSALLEDSFKEHSTLNPKQKQALAEQLNLRPRQVEVWFQNRRARTKLKQIEVDCDLLKKCCETLTEENKRLHKEVQELKALKLAAPLYMQLPAATLTVCPSCERIGGAATTGGSGGGTSTGQFTIPPKPHFFNPFTNPSAAC